jgi:hypothetical protein
MNTGMNELNARRAEFRALVAAADASRLAADKMEIQTAVSKTEALLDVIAKAPSDGKIHKVLCPSCSSYAFVCNGQVVSGCTCMPVFCKTW